MRAFLHRFDSFLIRFVQGWPEWVRPIMRFASRVGRPTATLSTAFLIIIVGLLQSDTGLVLAGIMAAAALGIGSILKLMLRRSRPPSNYTALMRIKSFSFPSGHSLGSVVSFGLVAYLLWRIAPVYIGGVIVTSSALLCFLIGSSRVYLGAHFPSDVIAGWVLGGMALAVIISSLQVVV